MISPHVGHREQYVVAVTEDGTAAGPVRREEAHEPFGVLHLAVSVQLVTHAGLWILQRRSTTKLLFGGLWANSCCTHPLPGESPLFAASRRVHQELGANVMEPMRPAGAFTYRAFDPASGLVEYERDHVYVGLMDPSSVNADAEEIAETRMLPFGAAMRLVSSSVGAPWAAHVLSLSKRALRRV
jgi:isopentenyl-diphosphate delta-isomerase